MKFILNANVEMELNNDAFQENRQYEIHRILEKLIKKYVEPHINEDYSDDFPLYDINGNKVGKAEVSFCYEKDPFDDEDEEN